MTLNSLILLYIHNNQKKKNQMKISTYFSSSCNILTMKCLIKLDSFVYLNFKLRIRIVCLVNEQAQTNKQTSKI